MDKMFEELNLDPNEPISTLSPECVEAMHKHIAKKKVNAKPKIRKNPIPFVGEDHPKYRVTLKFVNKILANLGRDKIDDLTEFKNIDRLDIIKPKNNRILIKMEPEIFAEGLFTKVELAYYRPTKTPTLCLLRNMVTKIGLLCTYEQKEVTYKGKMRRSHYYYSIRKV